MKLDHRNLRTPLRKLFEVPTHPLALAVAQEWEAQGTFVQPALMHLVGQNMQPSMSLHPSLPPRQLYATQ